MVYVLGGLGVEEQTARQAIARAAASDWIIAERIGREVNWSLSPKPLHIFEASSPRVHSLKDSFSDWDGRWLTLFTTIPNSQKSARRSLYAGLTWAGFGNPTPGLWLSPHVERADEVHALVNDLGLEHQTVSLIGSVDSIGMSTTEIVQRGWDLDTLRDHYEQLLQSVSALTPSDGDEKLFAHLAMSSAWQELPREDPQLPEALLPDWIGRPVARRIEALRAQWTPTTLRRFDASTLRRDKQRQGFHNLSTCLVRSCLPPQPFSEYANDQTIMADQTGTGQVEHDQGGSFRPARVHGP